MKRSNSLYNHVMSLVDGMQIGDTIIIDIPENIISFRKYVSEIGKRYAERYTTKIIDNKLHIMRIKYHSILNKEVQ